MNGRSQLVVTKTGTVSSTAKSLVDFGFSADQVAAADLVIICVTSNALRLTYDTPDNPGGTTHPPTSTEGLRLPTNNYPLFEIQGRPNAGNLLMIRDASSDATVAITIESN